MTGRFFKQKITFHSLLANNHGLSEIEKLTLKLNNTDLQWIKKHTSIENVQKT